MSMSKRNLISIVIGFVLIMVGTWLALFSYSRTDKKNYSTNNKQDATEIIQNIEVNIKINVGCSLIASGIVILIQTIMNGNIRKNDPLKAWKLQNIYIRREGEDKDFAATLKKTKKQLDIVAFGLRKFREDHMTDLENLLKNNVKIRILTMNPMGRYITYREKEEEGANIKESIKDLATAIKNINDKYDNKVELKGYNCMTLDYYFRMDNTIYVGQYWYRKNGRDTLTYKFTNKGLGLGLGFNLYTKYFETLWKEGSNTNLLETKQNNNGNHK